MVLYHDNGNGKKYNNDINDDDINYSNNNYDNIFDDNDDDIDDRGSTLLK